MNDIKINFHQQKTFIQDKLDIKNETLNLFKMFVYLLTSYVILTN